MPDARTRATISASSTRRQRQQGRPLGLAVFYIIKNHADSPRNAEIYANQGFGMTLSRQSQILLGQALIQLLIE
jgi:hypothetical protein